MFKSGEAGSRRQARERPGAGAPNDYVAAIEAFHCSRPDASTQRSATMRARIQRTADLLLGAIAGCGLLLGALLASLIAALDHARRCARRSRRRTHRRRRPVADDVPRPRAATRSASCCTRCSAWISKLRAIVGEVRGSRPTRSATASAQIASGNDDLSQRTEQASSLQQTASSDGADHRHRQAERRQRAPGQPARRRRARRRREQGRRGRVAGGRARWARSTQLEQKIADIIGVIDEHRVPDQHPGAERRRRSGARRRAGPRLRGRRDARCAASRSARAEAAKEIKGLIRTARSRRSTVGSRARRRGRQDDRARSSRSVQRVTDIIGEITAASRASRARHRAGQQRRHAAGPGDAAERRAGRGGLVGEQGDGAAVFDAVAQIGYCAARRDGAAPATRSRQCDRIRARIPVHDRSTRSPSRVIRGASGRARRGAASVPAPAGCGRRRCSAPAAMGRRGQDF